MIRVEPQVYLAAHRFGIIADAGGKRCPPQDPSVTEFAAPDGRVLSGKIEDADGLQCWLAGDLVQPARDALERERADFDRARAQVRGDYAEKDAREAAKWGLSVDEYRARRRELRPLPAPMSSALYHAAARHHQRTGRLWDHNARADLLRGQLVRDLGRAVEAEQAAARDGSN